MKSQSNSQELDKVYTFTTLKAQTPSSPAKGFLTEEAKAKLLQLALSIIGEDEKPDVQLTERAYMYSGEVEGRNKLRVELRQAFKEKFGG